MFVFVVTAIVVDVFVVVVAAVLYACNVSRSIFESVGFYSFISTPLSVIVNVFSDI